MNNKTKRIIFLVSTALLSLMMFMSAGMYLFKHEMVREVFTNLGFPPFIIYPLAVAKILGVIMLWVRKPNWLKEWAYAGFFFDFLLAGAAHLIAKDGEHWAAVTAMALLIVSHIFAKKTGK